MILNLSAEQLRKIATQIEALNDLRQAGGPDFDGQRVITVDGDIVAFLYWDVGDEQFLARFLDATSANTREIYDLAGKKIEFPYGKDKA